MEFWKKKWIWSINKVPLIRNNGDHYEGQWVNDKREGQGSYYFKEKAKLLVGEWVNDVSKSGIYTEVEDPDLLAKIPK